LAQLSATEGAARHSALPHAGFGRPFGSVFRVRSFGHLVQLLPEQVLPKGSGASTPAMACLPGTRVARPVLLPCCLHPPHELNRLCQRNPSPEAEDEPKLRRTYRNSPPMKISTTDPDAALSSKRGASEFAYYDYYLIDNRSCIIAGVMATPRAPHPGDCCRPTHVGESERALRVPVTCQPGVMGEEQRLL